MSVHSLKRDASRLELAPQRFDCRSSSRHIASSEDEREVRLGVKQVGGASSSNPARPAKQKDARAASWLDQQCKQREEAG
ncbi:MAG: hypothetical protein SGPRY_007207 [Prymnesium sp.]